jgi:hypothetical protein
MFKDGGFDSFSQSILRGMKRKRKEEMMLQEKVHDTWPECGNAEQTLA